MIAILTVIKWVMLLICSLMGMVLLATDPNQQMLGFILSFGCFLIFAIDVARNFID